MSPTDLADFFEMYPTTPLRLTLGSGDMVDVPVPQQSIIEGLSVYIGQPDERDARMARRVQLISIPNITLIERVDRRPSGSRRR